MSCAVIRHLITILANPAYTLTYTGFGESELHEKMAEKMSGVEYRIEQVV